MKQQKTVNAKTRTQIALEYGVSRRTFYNWLKKEGIFLRSRTLVTPKELTRIYEQLGHPYQEQ